MIKCHVRRIYREQFTFICRLTSVQHVDVDVTSLKLMYSVTPRLENIAYFLPRLCKELFYFLQRVRASLSCHRRILRMTLKTYLREKRSVNGIAWLSCRKKQELLLFTS